LGGVVEPEFAGGISVLGAGVDGALMGGGVTFDPVAVSSFLSQALRATAITEAIIRVLLIFFMYRTP
jgi:hypothetical protein